MARDTLPQLPLFCSSRTCAQGYRGCFSSTSLGVVRDVPGKPWTLEEEDKCREMLKQGEPLAKICQALCRNQDAIIVKAKRCGWKLPAGCTHTTTMLTLPEDVMEPERVLKILHAALEATAKAGLDRIEIQRLTAVANIARTYNELFKDYEHWEELDRKIKEINERLAVLEAEATAQENSTH